MSEPTEPPYAEAVERLGDAVVGNATLGAEQARALAASMEAAAAAGGPAARDALATAMASSWVAALRAMAAAASAITDAAAMMSYPPEPALYSFDLTALARTEPMVVTVDAVRWSSPNETAPLPKVTVEGPSQLPPPAAGAPDLLVLRRRPPVRSKVPVATLTLAIGSSVPLHAEFRLDELKYVSSP